MTLILSILAALAPYLTELILAAALPFVVPQLRRFLGERAANLLADRISATFRRAAVKVQAENPDASIAQKVDRVVGYFVETSPHTARQTGADPVALRQRALAELRAIGVSAPDG